MSKIVLVLFYFYIVVYYPVCGLEQYEVGRIRFVMFKNNTVDLTLVENKALLQKRLYFLTRL
ncbi:hypothetical protein TPENAI_70078 [Tenacibaculum litopenaei]